MPDLNSIKFTDDTLYLRRLNPDDVSVAYVNWLNDPDINKYLESRTIQHTLLSTVDYIHKLCDPQSLEFIFGIFLCSGDKHIGNIKLGPVNYFHKHAAVGLIIGDKSYWGRGYGSRAIKLIVRIAFEQFCLKCLTAGCYSSNISSLKSFIKAGWKQSGSLSAYWQRDNNNRDDQLLLTINYRPCISIQELGGVTLAGFSSLMIAFIKLLNEYSIDVIVLIAPRHLSEETECILNDLGCKFIVTQNPNTDIKALSTLSLYNRFCMCFGPAWIFDDSFLSIFEGRIFNYNGIPLPAYLGGAHYTWQILNSSQKGGCYIQQITNKIDRGPFIMNQQYVVDSSVITPAGYDSVNHLHGLDLLSKFLKKVTSTDKVFPLENDLVDWNNSKYFPRLHTKTNAWIDWSWSGEDIERFCNAFDDPYPGAQSLIDGITVSFRQVVFESFENVHPYCSGLVLNASYLSSSYDSLCIILAVKHGFLRVGHVHYSDSIPPSFLKVGSRFYTPLEYLYHSKQSIMIDSNGISSSKMKNTSI